MGMPQVSNDSLRREVLSRSTKRLHTKHAGPKTSTFAAYAGVFLLIMSLVAVSYQTPKSTGASANVAEVSGATSTFDKTGRTTASVDELLATSLAANLAERSDLPVASNVANLYESMSVENELAQTDDSITAKPQIVEPMADDRAFQQYVAKTGDTIPSIAASYGISAQTLKWANNMTSDAVEPGKTLTVPPTDGVVYTVKAGDTIDSIANKYKADKARLIAFNDLEISGVQAGKQIVVPSGNLPEQERPGYVAPRVNTGSYNGINYGNYGGGSASRNYLSASVGNRYGYGQCTWYVYERRAQLGRPVGSFWGNASTWAYNASRSGYKVGTEPEVGAIMQNGGGYYGHVAVVESKDVVRGVIVITEMNGYRFGGGWNRIGRGEISLAEARSGMYKYIY